MPIFEINVDMLRPIVNVDALLESLRSGDLRVEYADFLAVVLPCIVGQTRFRQNASVMPMRDFVTALDEAFALVCVMNYQQRWIEKWYYDDAAGAKSKKVPKVICPYISRNRFVTTCQASGGDGGWFDEGKDKYEEICQLG